MEAGDDEVIGAVGAPAAEGAESDPPASWVRTLLRRPDSDLHIVVEDGQTSPSWRTRWT